MAVDLDRRSVLAGSAALLVLSQTTAAAEPGRTDTQMKNDWPWLDRYAADNTRLLASGPRSQIVFMGDSITEGWIAASASFFKPGWVNRGIGGQTSPQMVLRMASDVVSLQPKLVHILAGTNDVAGNTGPMTSAMTLDNIRAMVAIARAARIAVLLGSIPPATSFYWSPAARPAEQIAESNAMIQHYAKEQKIAFVDYYVALADPTGGMDPRYSNDGVHPNAAGYAAMERAVAPIAERLLRRAK